MFIFFDTETNGLPKEYGVSPNVVDNWPRMIQVAWALYDEQANLVKKRCELIKPDGWVVPTEEFWIKNGYSTEINEKLGKPVLEILHELCQDRATAHYSVNHNLTFDRCIVSAEMIRAGIREQYKFNDKKFCTMQNTQIIQMCALPKPSGKSGYKWPTLTELHNKVFGHDFVNAHDAGADIEACANCFFELLKRGVTKLH